MDKLAQINAAVEAVERVRSAIDHARSLLDEVRVPEYSEMDSQMEYADSWAESALKADEFLQSAETELRTGALALEELAEEQKIVEQEG